MIASDCRLGAPGSALERSFGDGAAAFLLGDADAIASFEAAHAVADEIVDVWRVEGDRFVHSWEERFVIQEGYLPESGRGRARPAREAGGRRRPTSTRVALYAPDERSHASLARALRLAAGQLQDPLFGRLGNTGAAFAPHAARRGARAGAGPASACSSRATATAPRRSRCASPSQIEKLEPRRGVAWHLARRRAGAELRPLSARPRPRRARVRAAARRRPLRDDPLPRARRGRLLQGPALPRLRGGAVPDPARLRDLLRARTTSSCCGSRTGPAASSPTPSTTSSRPPSRRPS